MREVQVLIAGGGPVRMTLARDLARRGITCMLVERNLTTTRHPKMDITNARSMELFRRLALADELRAVAVPESNNFDVSWITSLSGHELHRFAYLEIARHAAHEKCFIGTARNATSPSRPRRSGHSWPTARASSR